MNSKRIASPPPLPGYSDPPRPLSWAGLLCGWAGLLTFAGVDGWRTPSWVVLAVALVTSLLRGRWLASWPYALAASLPLVAGVGLFGEPWFEGSDFTSSFMFRLALGLALLQCLAFLRQYIAQEELAAYSLSGCLTMAAAFTYENHLIFIASCVAAQILGLALAMRLRVKGAGYSGAALVALGLALALGGGAALLLRMTESRVSRFLGIFVAPSGASFSFSGSSPLDTLSRNEKNPMVILRYRSTAPPRYLVGNTYVNFTGKLWKTNGEYQGIPGQPIEDGLFRYLLGVPHERPGDPTPTTIDDSVEMGGRGLSLFLPRDCQTLDINSPALARRWGDTFQASNPGVYAGLYRLKRTSQRLVPGWKTLDPSDPAATGQEDRSLYLQLPANLNPVVARLAEEKSRGSGGDLQRAQRLENFLQDDYTYGYDYPFSKSRDPVGEFLEKKPPAHCELFASALTLMLRTLHIPARYINGFIIREESVTGGYYVVRARDGHAWVEAFIDGAWIVLDPTPPAALASQRRNDWWEALGDWFNYNWNLLTKLDLEKLSAQVLAKLRDYGGYLLGLAALIWMLRNPPNWAGTFFWKRSGGAPTSAELEELPLILSRFEKMLASRGLRRPPEMTLTRWNAHLGDSGELHQLAGGFLSEYVQLRYATEARSQDLGELMGRLELLAGFLQKSDQA